MKIIKAKLIKGQFLEIEYNDGTAVVKKNFPTTEAPPPLRKAFAALNRHLCELTCQFTEKGEYDWDNVTCRGFFFKGEGEKEEMGLTGLRSLPNGRTLIIPSSPKLNLEADAGYSKMTDLQSCLNNCREAIVTFMDNNKSPDEIQGVLQGVLFAGEKPADTKTHILKATAKDAPQNEEEEDAWPEETAPVEIGEGHENIENEVHEERPFPDSLDDITHSPEEIQKEMDEEMPLTQEMLQAANARKNRAKGKRQAKK